MDVQRGSGLDPDCGVVHQSDGRRRRHGSILVVLLAAARARGRRGEPNDRPQLSARGVGSGSEPVLCSPDSHEPGSADRSVAMRVILIAGMVAVTSASIGAHGGAAGAGGTSGWD